VAPADADPGDDSGLARLTAAGIENAANEWRWFRVP
jgi:hypothetical protein